MRPLDKYIREQLNDHADDIGSVLDSDVMAVSSPIVPGLDVRFRDAVESITDHKDAMSIVVDTQGGIVEVVERMVNTLRHFYDEVYFIIPNRAMSAGTVLVMSGDRILMDHFSCLGPIDPQVEKDGRLIPALSYLYQFDRLNEKSLNGRLTSAEYALLQKLDLGELYQFEQAVELSKELLVKWLSEYKFKDWDVTESRGLSVTQEMKTKRAEEIAEQLSRNDYWHSHGRGITMQTLIEEIQLKIEDYSEIDTLNSLVREYFELLNDYMNREQMQSFVHTQTYF